MNCPNCGGGLQPVGNRNYFRCPYCETFHFPEETGDGIAVVGGDSNYDCPICEKSLILAAIEGLDVMYCAVCRGFLATNATFGQVVQAKRAKETESPQVPIPFSREELNRRIFCPSCHKPMDTHPYHAGGNAVIDTCPRCQLVWLDAGELTVIGEYKGRAAPPIRTLQLDEDSPIFSRPVTNPPETTVNLFGFRIHLD